ncbi:MAG: ADP-ribose pyrophosphatase [Candidatus Azambacteria bacterium GW2011_GWE1_42_9]|nr:MAG: ADP-ribose pyrophosphatase [Candidatus Azambacteria bacterium GW2011_GWF1_41_10]KKS49034.1 MAG: ADP-ribose pyrophosphatase [Candidatus Azambacteria bacterium GW2011_GWF2_42_22]KKS69126.1 MAG: ADP-ribose pyrophosphatase [Candidatus Azambacteria bacterium GW2011_GWA2_42_62]KKS73569.1 MAG: ADP-ribose pyrophosphatase [Candidatus Azambacteria bacterium GW2011_GWB1_42_72]KKS79665.1 MAG: ADP-ribose pyrophosphatase [Candidatus Azambacteria bacterium GW2011_GWE1_42_9]KKT03194.1 MAG: ADP-ribose 
MKGQLIKITPISKKFHNVFRFSRRTAEVALRGGKKYRFDRHVFETGPAVSVLPYFFDEQKKEWMVVLVRQYRPAVDALCLEAPGGLLEKGVNPRLEMTRELFEEAGIRVSSQKIKYMGYQHLASSFCDQVVHLGSAHLSDVKSAANLLASLRIHNGLMSEHEFTEVVVVPLLDALRKPRLVTYTLAKYQILQLADELKISWHK